jgi:hypothetical protein
MAPAPTDVELADVVDGHGPPCCIDQLTPTPVGNPLTMTRPARCVANSKSRGSSASSGPVNTKKVSDRSLAERVFCVGSAFYDHQGKYVSALSITGLKAEVPLREVQRLGGIVKNHTNRLTTILGGSRKRMV